MPVDGGVQIFGLTKIIIFILEITYLTSFIFLSPEIQVA
jgi:hypothetical protein